MNKLSSTLIIDCAGDIGSKHADLVNVRQELFNLLSNAAMFTEGGSFTPSVRKRTDAAAVTFAIRDTRIGMTEAQLTRL